MDFEQGLQSYAPRLYVEAARAYPAAPCTLDGLTGKAQPCRNHPSAARKAAPRPCEKCGVVKRRACAKTGATCRALTIWRNAPAPCSQGCAACQVFAGIQARRILTTLQAGAVYAGTFDKDNPAHCRAALSIIPRLLAAIQRATLAGRVRKDIIRNAPPVYAGAATSDFAARVAPLYMDVWRGVCARALYALATMPPAP